MEVVKLVESESSYRRELREAARGYWSGVLSFGQFFESMLSSIRRGLRRAWEQGFKDCGLSLGDMTADERAELERRIVSENSFLGRYAAFIESNSKANGGLLRTVFNRSELWINRFRDMLNRAKQIACDDQKFKWLFQPGKDHCKSCRRLHGRVYRASVWRSHGVRPQNPPNSQIECGGWRCGCEFQQTTDRVTPGPFPALP